ncbi:TRF2-interacting telomeric protein/Rap1 C terminal domain-containing protein [Podospora conica]|nr:TRF2-interacting telomeric protein/Rap1 C terminal domain-containing protein [Schizothecium conicum]
MAPPIVYENVTRVADKDENTLFNGVKFWVHQRVPLRSSIISSITANGGQDVKLEKLADVIIADHARKDAPPNSVSWKYITNSVQQGRLADIDEYRIGGPAGPGRSTVGTSAPAKQTRTPFTPEEDRKLVEHVKGQLYPNGNVCYQEFASKYPRHTWQSYKDHYRRYLSNTLDEGEAASPGSKPTALQQQTSVPQPPPVSTTNKRKFFTAEENKILRDYVMKRVEEGEGESGNGIYKELEEMYPHRTFHSWRDRWVRHERKRPEAEPEPSNSPDVREAPRVLQQARVPQSSEAPRPSLAPQPARISPPSRQHQASLEHQTREPRAQRQSTHSVTPTLNGGKLAQIALRAEQGLRKRAAIVIQRRWRVWRHRQAVRSQLLDSEPDQLEMEIKEESPETEARIPSQHPIQDHAVAEPETDEAAVQFETEDLVEGQPEEEILQHAGVTNDDSHESPPPASSKQTRSDKEQFYIDIQEYYQFSGLPLKMWLTVENKALELWDLWKAVTSQDEENGYRDWEEIAEKLNFDWLDNPDVTNQLEAAFDENLKGFEEQLKSFEEAMDMEEGEDSEGSSQESPAPSQNFDSSPPVPGTKRSREHIHSPDLGFSPPRKRPRYHDAEEVPETPQKSELGGQTTPRTGHIVEPMSLRTKRQHDLAQGAGTKIMPEPETQDFTFGQHLAGQEAEPDPLLPQDRESSLADDSDGSEFPTLKELREHPEKYKPQRKPPAASQSSSDDAFGTPLETPPTRPARKGQAAGPTSARKPQPASSAAAKRTPRPMLTNRYAPMINPPPRQPGSHPSRATRPPAPQPRALPPQPSPPKPPQPKSLTREEIEALEQHYVDAGYRLEDIKVALQATSMVVDKAELVMENLRSGHGIPRNTRGVWTTVDDEDLAFVTMGDGQGARPKSTYFQREAGKKLERLKLKHGARGVEERKRFLARRGKGGL